VSAEINKGLTAAQNGDLSTALHVKFLLLCMLLASGEREILTDFLAIYLIGNRNLR
jgi:hypothetical protein